MGLPQTPAKSFEDLMVWQKAHQFVLRGYALFDWLPLRQVSIGFDGGCSGGWHAGITQQPTPSANSRCLYIISRRRSAGSSAAECFYGASTRDTLCVRESRASATPEERGSVHIAIPCPPPLRGHSSKHPLHRI